MPGEKIGPSKAPAPVATAAESLIEVFCGACNQGYRVESSLAGKSGQCSCGSTFLIPSHNMRSAPSAPSAHDPYALPDPYANDPFGAAPAAPMAADPLAMDYDFDISAPGAAGPSAAQDYHDAIPVEPIAVAAPNQYAAPNQHGVPTANPLGAPPAQQFGGAAPPPPAAGGYWNRPSSAASGLSGSQQPSRRDAYKKGKKQRKKSGGGGISMVGIGNMAFGTMIFLGSVGFTYASYAAADAGEEYWILYGPMIWGAIHFFAGIVQIITGAEE